MLVPDLLSLFAQITNEFVRSLFSEYTEEVIGSASRIRTITASNKIKVILTNIYSCRPHPWIYDDRLAIL
jgi:hypothetical protein